MKIGLNMYLLRMLKSKSIRFKNEFSDCSKTEWYRLN